jgi:hypothetical protein
MLPTDFGDILDDLFSPDISGGSPFSCDKCTAKRPQGTSYAQCGKCRQWVCNNCYDRTPPSPDIEDSKAVFTCKTHCTS